MSVEPASYQHAALIKQQANRLGFDLVGITSAQPSQRADYFRQWLDENQAGTMAWMHGRFDERVDVSQYLPGCQSVVCVAISYYPAADRADERSNPTLVHPLPVPRGRAGVRGVVQCGMMNAECGMKKENHESTRMNTNQEDQ